MISHRGRSSGHLGLTMAQLMIAAAALAGAPIARETANGGAGVIYMPGNRPDYDLGMHNNRAERRRQAAVQRKAR